MAGGEPRQLFIVSGPSGSGKTTVVDCLLREAEGLLFSVSCTTRLPRAGEQDGRAYHFVTREAFEAMVVRDELLEYATVFGELYGTPRRNLREAAARGQDLVLDIDVQGARQVKAKLPEAVAILLLPPSAAALSKRLRARAQDTPEVIQRRLDRAREEIEHYQSYDYLVVNSDLEETCATLKAIVESERCRHQGGQPAPAVEARAAAAQKDTNKTQISAILESFGARAE